MTVSRLLRRSLLPVSVFVLVLVLHFMWLIFFPERDPAQDRWLRVGAQSGATALRTYVESKSYYLGFSYALSLAFAAYALRAYREQRQCAARNAAVGGVTFSGFLAVLGCYLIGCCGSPMLAVYMNLLGAAFLPFAKPLVAGLTTVMTAIAFAWMRRRDRATSEVASSQQDSCCA